MIFNLINLLVKHNNKSQIIINLTFTLNPKYPKCPKSRPLSIVSLFLILQLQDKPFDQLPEVSHILDSDLQRLYQALKKQKSDRSYYAILKTVLSEVKKKLGHKDYSKPLLQISLSQLEGKPYYNDLRLRICESIIDCEELHRINLLQHTVNELTSQNLTDPSLRVRLQIVRAGKWCLKNDFVKAASSYLNASKLQGVVKDEDKKIQLLNKSIALSYVAPRCQQNHKTICALCLNQLSQKSHLRSVLKKLYTEDLLSSSECEMLEKELPSFLGRPDVDGVSFLNQAKFEHNMIPIMNSFRTISFKTLQRLLSMKMEDVLVLLQKSLNQGLIKIDQEDEIIEFMEKDDESKEKLKELLNKIDQTIEQFL